LLGAGQDSNQPAHVVPLLFRLRSDGNPDRTWLVKEYINMSVTQTLKTWSVCETIIPVSALIFTLLLSLAV
jgi:hypothetical protein